MNTTYIAFLRGINVGGNTMVKMTVLKEALESLGCTNVTTVLNSGNVVFGSSETNATSLNLKIEEKLEKTFGWKISVMLRSDAHIQELIHSEPFKEISVTPQARLYVTFLSEPAKSTLKNPHQSPKKDFQILRVSDTEVCSVLILSVNKGTIDLMKIIEKEFGKKVTTRNWNTVLKIGKILS